MTKLLALFGFLSLGILFGFSTPTFAAGQYALSPSTGTFYVGRQFETQIQMTTDQATTASDIQVTFDSCKLDVVDALSAVAGVQIFPGSAYPNYPNGSNTVTVAGCSGLIKLTGFTSDPTGILQGGGTAVFGTIRFLVKDTNLSGSPVAIVTTGFGPTFTLDSNISNTSGIDMLNAVTSGNYVLREDNNPVPDTDDRPFFSSISPLSGAASIPIGSNISLTALDNESGVDISTLQIGMTINGGAAQIVTNTSSQISTACVTSNYNAVPSCNILLNPSTDFPYDAQVCLTLDIKDLARAAGTLGNIANSAQQIVQCFRTQYDLNPPYATNITPAQNSSGASVSTAISVIVHDDETGVDIDSVIITIAGVDYTKSGTNQFLYTGTPSAYTITVQPSVAFAQNQVVAARIRAKDRATQLMVSVPNILDQSYTFRTIDSVAPFVTRRSPANNLQFANQCDPIIFHLEDTGSGVNISSARVMLSNGKTYTASGVDTFLYTGTSADYTIKVAAPVGCWAINQSIAVAIFALDNDSNYLDADIYVINSSSNNIQTIVNTVIQYVPTTITNEVIREVSKEVIKNVPVTITIETAPETVLKNLSEKYGFEITPQTLEQVKDTYQQEQKRTLQPNVETKTSISDDNINWWLIIALFISAIYSLHILIYRNTVKKLLAKISIQKNTIQ